ncbi:MAG: hypothetical protein ACTHM8_14425 [Sphingomonas sp.]
MAVLAFATAIAATTMARPASAEILDSAKSIDLNVHGEISQHCAMGTIGDVNFGDLNRPNISTSQRIAFSCNLPFNMKIEAANGGLTNTLYPHGQGPYSGTLPYTIDIAIPVRKPQSAEVDRSFNSRDLVGGRTFSSDGGVAFDGMGLTVALGRPSGEAGLLAGSYAETLVITVTPV